MFIVNLNSFKNFLRKGRIRIQLLKWFQNFWSFKGRTPSVPLFKNESWMMLRHTIFHLLPEIFKEVAFFMFQGFSKQRICIFKYLEVEYI
ncbi:hypothetical protein CN563_02555 [Bacillus sp. AFS026049]|nr:hypothetical protein CN563_02555 [Bacillus sp. AFS026049]